MAQERVAKAGAVKPARAAAAPKTPAAPPAAPAAKAPTPTKGSTAADPHLTVSTDAGTVDQHLGQDLADVHGDSQSKAASGEERMVESVVVAKSTVPRAVATPRLLRHMGADRATLKLAEDFHACYAAESTEKTAEFAIVRLEVGAGGDVESTKIDSGADASPAVAACIDASSMRTKFGAPGGIGTIVLVQVRAR